MIEFEGEYWNFRGTRGRKLYDELLEYQAMKNKARAWVINALTVALQQEHLERIAEREKIINGYDLTQIDLRGKQFDGLVVKNCRLNSTVMSNCCGSPHIRFDSCTIESVVLVPCGDTQVESDSIDTLIFYNCVISQELVETDDGIILSRIKYSPDLTGIAAIIKSRRFIWSGMSSNDGEKSPVIPMSLIGGDNRLGNRPLVNVLSCSKAQIKNADVSHLSMSQLNGLRLDNCILPKNLVGLGYETVLVNCRLEGNRLRGGPFTFLNCELSDVEFDGTLVSRMSNCGAMTGRGSIELFHGMTPLKYAFRKPGYGSDLTNVDLKMKRPVPSFFESYFDGDSKPRFAITESVSANLDYTSEKDRRRELERHRTSFIDDAGVRITSQDFKNDPRVLMLEDRLDQFALQGKLYQEAWENAQDQLKNKLRSDWLSKLNRIGLDEDDFTQHDVDLLKDTALSPPSEDQLAIAKDLEIFLHHFVSPSHQPNPNDLIDEYWNYLEQNLLSGELIKGQISEGVNGGFLLDIGQHSSKWGKFSNQIRAFMPASLSPKVRSGNWREIIGQEIDVYVIEVHRRRKNVVLSSRENARDSTGSKNVSSKSFTNDQGRKENLKRFSAEGKYLLELNSVYNGLLNKLANLNLGSDLKYFTIFNKGFDDDVLVTGEALAYLKSKEPIISPDLKNMAVVLEPKRSVDRSDFTRVVLMDGRRGFLTESGTISTAVLTGFKRGDILRVVEAREPEEPAIERTSSNDRTYQSIGLRGTRLIIDRADRIWPQ